MDTIDRHHGVTRALARLARQTTADLIEGAWALRRANFPDRIDFAAPGARRYDTASYRNRRNSFVEISVTGKACALRCEHCQGRLLERMIPAGSAEEMLRIGKALRRRDCRGVLVSGGATADGRVPLEAFVGALAELKALGLRVIVHCGLVDPSTASGLQEAGVDQVLLDVIGDAATIREVYHLDRGPDDYRRSLDVLKSAGVALAPHVIVGLHGGRVRGEYEALRHIAEVGVERLVLVVLNPLPGTPLAGLAATPVDEVARVMSIARLLNPSTPISLGCARPAGRYRASLDRLAVDVGVNAIAYPSEEAVAYARQRGLAGSFHELCCTLM